jgi:hypothetical protein
MPKAFVLSGGGSRGDLRLGTLDHLIRMAGIKALAGAMWVIATLVPGTATSQPYNVCYDLLEPIWNPPTYTDVVECINPILCLAMPHCCLPTCRLHPECTFARQIIENPGSMETTKCEVLPVEKIAELFLRGQLRHVDDVLAPGVQQILYGNVLALKAQGVPIPLGIQSLFSELLSSQIGSGMPSFEMKHVQRARIIPRSAGDASLFLRSGFSAITLNDLIIVNDNHFTALMSTAVPSNAKLSDIKRNGPLFDSLARSFSLLSHEAVHVRQYDELGPDAFINNYLLETLTKGYGSDPFEKEAFNFGDAVRQALDAPPAPPATPNPGPSRNTCRESCQRMQHNCIQQGVRINVCSIQGQVCNTRCPP